ncbi:FAD/NAD(P)-binding domain-containing protein [Chloropicon primus]|uniref:FAD/NAD(P)-binding domain-containing protein n=3 Tax=Chloropicon primus TaxID=1764295 RepID=A0A5B8MBI3_9CHLO|nr:FAD/NAD(P)-binding domain-containing protein [Chloropicon primus]UPQ96797.1 FAD/NAD(P)-binding domain-containing protein [Chloropicon primus]|eukprot:QDZ17579.1 FAD/NAD(P)-binding domain-containing protein [Chloropicon primus]
MGRESARYDYVVVGGGVAGTCCARLLCCKAPKASVCLVSPTESLKTVKVVKRVTDNLDELTVIEQPVGSFNDANLEFAKDYVESIDPEEKTLVLGGGRRISYGKLAVCTGASPRVHLSESPRLITVRDTDSAESLREVISRSNTRRVVVAGNGAIALEVINKLSGVEVVWIVKHDHVGDSLLDVDVALHLLESFQKRNKGTLRVDQSRGGAEDQGGGGGAAGKIREERFRTPPVKPDFGHALGPKWHEAFPKSKDGRETSLRVVYNRKLVGVDEGTEGDSEGWPISAVLSDGERIGGDVIISCIGVVPNTTWLPRDRFQMAPDGGLSVSARLETSVKDVYAAGDVCTLDEENLGPQFFQIRLWSQARMMAEFAAHCMTDSKEAEFLDLGFDLFTHVTHFFGSKVILLGLYDGQRLAGEPEKDKVLYTRETEDTFVRVLLLRGRMQGAVLVGETDLEEVFENLILGGIDLSRFGPEMLDPENDIEDFFD